MFAVRAHASNQRSLKSVELLEEEKIERVRERKKGNNCCSECTHTYVRNKCIPAKLVVDHHRPSPGQSCFPFQKEKVQELSQLAGYFLT